MITLVYTSLSLYKECTSGNCDINLYPSCGNNVCILCDREL